MDKILFLCDIDNTLLYSGKFRQEGDICVEYINGKEQGYMPADAYDAWEKVYRSAEIVPVTTRSVEQYRRILWPFGLKPAYAVTTNGGILLHGEETERLYGGIRGEDREELERLYGIYSTDPCYIRCRIVDDTYLFVYCAPSCDTEEQYEKVRQSTALTVYLSGKKIYAVPDYISKERALEYLKRKFSFGKVIGAGDSVMDAGMLERTDIALVPQGLKINTDGQLLRAEDGESFPAFVLKTVSDIVSRPL